MDHARTLLENPRSLASDSSGDIAWAARGGSTGPGSGKAGRGDVHPSYVRQSPGKGSELPVRHAEDGVALPVNSAAESLAHHTIWGASENSSSTSTEHARMVVHGFISRINESSGSRVVSGEEASQPGDAAAEAACGAAAAGPGSAQTIDEWVAQAHEVSAVRSRPNTATRRRCRNFARSTVKEALLAGGVARAVEMVAEPPEGTTESARGHYFRGILRASLRREVEEGGVLPPAEAPVAAPANSGAPLDDECSEGAYFL
eukprot:NODE_13881_length_1141_cov_5.242604.p1 GENE.NODE_13881_length_1141_cov_5.242604~~NODE_13881_length_1141_cov_5.242604.p1  ORF type:complete len:260 (-),score=25.98 NODE_13881_length_1141_cov_5.242604:218-997(-)